MEVADGGILRFDEVFTLFVEESFLVLDADFFTEALPQFDSLSPLEDHLSLQTFDIMSR